jgi:hypothetical protein
MILKYVKFMLKFWTLLMKKAGMKLKFCIIFHLQINGQTRRVNEILNQYVYNYIIDDCRNPTLG